jgi:phosphohistidine swiveling domain-containing protein
MWEKINTRRLAPQMAIAWNLGFGEDFDKVYGASIKKTLQYFDGKSTDYYVDANEYKKFNRRLEDLLEDYKFLDGSYGEAKQFLESVLDWTESNFNKDLSKLTDLELLTLYSTFSKDKMPKFYARMWMVYRISNPLSNAVERKLLEKTRDEKKTEKLMGIFSSPMHMNNVIEERIEFLKLSAIKKRTSQSKFNHKLKKHSEKFAYIPMYGFDHEPFVLAHFKGEIEKIIDPERELTNIERSYAGRREEFANALSELDPSPKLKQLLEFFSNMVYLRDYRDMIREKVNYDARNFYLELGRRANLSIGQINLLTNEEIVGFLKSGTLPSKSEILGREKSWLMVQNGKKVVYYSGKKAAEMALKELGLSGENETSELKGNCGSAGFAQGIARIIHSNKDLPKIKSGDIMVTSMTRQDFVPYLRKCAALVTDEGGITSHAAIICRELKIPCIVGTEFATETFIDGQRVEVDATNGIIRKIK